MFEILTKIAARKLALLLASDAIRCYKIFPEWRGTPLSGAAFGFHPSVQASNFFETAGFRVVNLYAGGKSISRGAAGEHPKIRRKKLSTWVELLVATETKRFAAGFFEGKARGKKVKNQTSMKGRDTRQEQ